MKSMESMATHVNNCDLEGMNAVAQQLKMSGQYINAGKLTYACYYLQEAYVNPNAEEMVHYYPLLIEAVCEFKRGVRKYLAEEHGKIYEEATN